MAGYGLTRDRVVAVVVGLNDGTKQVSSGYLVAPRRVLTAEHATRNMDGASTSRITGLHVVHVASGASTEVERIVASDPAIDVAVLAVAEHFGDEFDGRNPSLRVWGVDRSTPGVLADCVLIGLPRFAYDPTRNLHGSAEVHGNVHQTDGTETGHLLLRDPTLHGVHDPQNGRSGWRGLSGALVFYQSRALGVVVEQHPHQGDNSVHLIGFERIVTHPELRAALGHPESSDLEVARPTPVATTEPLDPTMARLQRILDLQKMGMLSEIAVATLQVRTVLDEFGVSPFTSSGGGNSWH